MKLQFRALGILACTALALVRAAALAQEPGFAPIPVRDADIRQGLTGWSVLPPKGTGWFLAAKGEGGVAFGKKGDQDDDNYTASVLVTRLDKPVENHEQLRLQARMSQDNSDPNRFKAVRFEFFQDAATRPELCVKRSWQSEDYGAVKRSSAAYLVLTASDLICRHPQDPKLIFTVHMSQRNQPGRLNTGLETLAVDFHAGFRFERLPRPEAEKK